MFVLQRYSDNKYVAKPGSLRSYVSGLQNAQTFRTHEEAERNRCVESERVEKVHCAC